MMDLKCKETRVQSVLNIAGFGAFHFSLKEVVDLTEHCII